LLCCALAVCCSAPAATNLEPAARLSLAKGEVLVQHWLVEGSPLGTRTWREGDSLHFDSTDGCSGSYPEPFSFAVSWESCGDGEWSTGGRAFESREGEIWPLEVGKTVRWTAAATNSEGSRSHNERICRVDGTERVEVPAGIFDAFRVICDDKKDRTTDHYAPALKQKVRRVVENKRNGRRKVVVLVSGEAK